MIRHLYQGGEDTVTCGQHCVAMLCDVTVEEVIAVMGHAGPTYHPEVLDAILILGRLPDPRRRLRFDWWTLEGDWLIDVRGAYGDQTWKHWIVKSDGQFYDPRSEAPGAERLWLYRPLTARRIY